MPRIPSKSINKFTLFYPKSFLQKHLGRFTKHSNAPIPNIIKKLAFKRTLNRPYRISLTPEHVSTLLIQILPNKSQPLPQIVNVNGL